MPSEGTDDRVAVKPYLDASTLALLDTRASQSLVPIRLPPKLRDRIERAQRRAAAAKDGVSIFATDAKASIAAPVTKRSSTAPATETLVLGETEERPRASTAMGGPGLTFAGDKMHLPDVVLSHKMRDFEARANTGGISTLLPAEPADRTLQKLPLEDRERVMMAMQNKIRQISSDVEANFARITKELDANGIFDSAANIQRAQTLCLVDLQRRCKLERLRDEAMREVLQPSMRKRSSQSTATRPSHKLSQLLKPTTSALFDSPATPSDGKSTPLTLRKRKPAKKLPALHPEGSRPKKGGNKLDGNLHSSTSFGQNNADTSGNVSPSGSRMLARRGGMSTSGHQLVSKEDNSAPGNTNAHESDLYSRHPHVAQILQLLAACGVSNSKAAHSAINSNSAEADMELARVLDPTDEWAQRSASYQVVGTRAADELRRRGERHRWDTLGHFGSKSCCVGASCMSTALRQRLENQQAAWGNNNDTPRSGDGSEASSGRDPERLASSQQQRDKEAYLELQTRIRERLRASERQTRTAAASVRVAGTPGRTRQPQAPQTAPSKMLSASSSMMALPSSGEFPPRGSQQHQEPALGVSSSEPVLHITTSKDLGSEGGSGLEAPYSLRRSLLGTRGRVFVLEQKLLVDSSPSSSIHGRHHGSLIGAPRAQLDSKAIGRHSEARITFRKDSAQTWAWHQSPSAVSESPVDTILEEEEDRFDEEGEDQCDDEDDSEVAGDGDDGTEYADDDLESVASGHTSARSALSMSSVKRRAGSGNSRKHGRKRPPSMLRRSSRGGSIRTLHGGNALSSSALSLHARLEVIWRALQFPFSQKLVMLERLSTLQDADAFLSALEHWERVTPLVAVRERMKLALSGFAERGKLRVNEWLTPSEVALVSALPQATAAGSATDSTAARKSSDTELDMTSASAFIDWIRAHMDAVTLQTLKLAQELKMSTGEELQFQGYPYLRRD